jgi:LmbE family N-acetylglucosaminyl deacetylase
LAPVARRLADLFARKGTGIVLTHAYEGGHPDHDAAAFAVHAAGKLLAHRAEKWPRFSAPNDALFQKGSIGAIPKVDSTFGSDALARRNPNRQLLIIEMPLYRADPSGWARQSFVPAPDSPELALWLGEDERALKERMVAAHVTQRDLLASFPIDVERFRAAPDYDFTSLPNGGDLLYERQDWGMTGARWLDLARQAFAELEGATA